MENYIKAKEYGEKHGLYLKIVTSVSNFEDYNSFFNIYSEYEEACRRILVLTPFKELEEVYDNNPSEKFKKGVLIDGNYWLEQYPLIINPNKIELEEIYLSKEDIDYIKSQK